MAILYLFIPEAGLGDTCDWALHAAGTLRHGSGACAELPPAEQIVAIVAASRVLLLHTRLPQVSTRKLRDMLAFAVEDQLLAEPDAVHAVAGTRARDGLTPVAVIDRDWLARQLARLEDHGIAPDRMFAETLLPRLEPQSWVLVWNGRGGFLRSGAQAGFAFDEANDSDADAPPFALQLALDEARAAGRAPDRLLVYHTAQTEAPAWVDRWHARIERRGVWAWQSAITGGIAGLNLLQGDFAPAAKRAAWLRRLQPAAWVAGLILAVHVLATSADWLRLRHERSALQGEMTSIFRTAFPEATAIVDPALQMRRNLAALRRSHGANDEADLLPLLAAVTPALRDGKIERLQYAQDQLQIDLALTDAAQLDNVRAQLAASRLPYALGAPERQAAGLVAHITLGATGGASLGSRTR